MSNKLQADEEFWAIFIDLFGGIRKIPWKYIIGNTVYGYLMVFTYLIGPQSLLSGISMSLSDIMLHSLYGAIVGILFSIGSGLPEIKKPDELEITKYFNKVKDKKAQVRAEYYKQSLDSIGFFFIIELFIWNVFSCMKYMVPTFNIFNVKNLSDLFNFTIKWN